MPEGWCCFLAVTCGSPVVFLSHILKSPSAGALFYFAVWIISSEPFKSLKSVPPNTQQSWTRPHAAVAAAQPSAPEHQVSLCGSAALGAWDYWHHGEIIPSLLLVFSEVSNWCHVRGREVGYPESPLCSTPPFIEVVWPWLCWVRGQREQDSPKAEPGSPLSKGENQQTCLAGKQPVCLQLRFNSWAKSNALHKYTQGKYLGPTQP